MSMQGGSATLAPFLKGVTLSKVKWIAFLAVWFGFPQPDLRYQEDVLPLAQQWANSRSTDSPLKEVVVLLTGATSGIGKGLVQQLTNLGATVIALGRSQDKLKSLHQQFPGVVPVQCQLDDLESVQKASKEITAQYKSIDILINNAELMTPLLIKSKFHPTIIQISSSFHWAVDGSELVVNDRNTMPVAASPKGLTGTLFKAQRAYANSKLAQILHARSLQRRQPSITIRSVCPGWVSTPIVGSMVQKIMLQPFAFRSDGFGLKSALYAIFQRQLPPNADFVTNTGMSGVILWLPKVLWSPLAYTLRIRDLVSSIYGIFMLQTQRFTPAIKSRQSSPESYNEERQEALYKWSYNTVKKYI